MQATLKTKPNKITKPKELPESWYKAQGLLRYKRKAIQREYERIRAEWR